MYVVRRGTESSVQTAAYSVSLHNATPARASYRLLLLTGPSQNGLLLFLFENYKFTRLRIF